MKHVSDNRPRRGGIESGSCVNRAPLIIRGGAVVEPEVLEPREESDEMQGLSGRVIRLHREQGIEVGEKCRKHC